MGLYWPNFSLVFLIHSFLHAGVYCSTLEKFEIAVFTLKTHQMFSVYLMPRKKSENATTFAHFEFAFGKKKQSDKAIA